MQKQSLLYAVLVSYGLMNVAALQSGAGKEKGIRRTISVGNVNAPRDLNGWNTLRSQLVDELYGTFNVTSNYEQSYPTIEDDRNNRQIMLANGYIVAASGLIRNATSITAGEPTSGQGNVIPVENARPQSTPSNQSSTSEAEEAKQEIIAALEEFARSMPEIKEID